MTDDRRYTVTEEEIGLQGDPDTWFVVREDGVPVADYGTEEDAQKVADRLERGLPA